MTEQPASFPSDLVGAVENAVMRSQGLDPTEVCGLEIEDGDNCDSSTCCAAHFEDHDPAHARAVYRKISVATIAEMHAYSAREGTVEADKKVLDDIWTISFRASVRGEKCDDEIMQVIANYRRASAGGKVDAIAEAVKPWADFNGELPDYDHPLRCVYESGIQYAVNLLAKELEVTDYTACDGTEEFDGDLGGTMMNIVCASLPEWADSERMFPSDVRLVWTQIGHCKEQIKRLREAIKPFSDCIDQIPGDESDEAWAKFRLLVQHYRAARTAFALSGGEE